MIPASYLYKNVFSEAWGDPRDRRAAPTACEPPAPGGGHFVGLAGLLASVLPLELGRGRRIMRQV
jgi:hypothetical protein